MIIDHSIRYYQTSLSSTSTMQTCSVCLMVLNESGVCSLCGSEEKAEVLSPNPKASEASVNLPFGLGEDSDIFQLDLPFGIEHLPSQSAGISPAKPPALKNGILPFGLEHIPNNDNYESQITETNSEQDTKQIGIEDEFPKNVQNTPEKSTNSSIYSDANLPFGIEHIFDSPEK